MITNNNVLNKLRFPLLEVRTPLDALHQKLMEQNPKYTKWHRHPYHQLFHWIFLLVFVGVMSIFIFIFRGANIQTETSSGHVLQASAAGPLLPLKLLFIHPEAVVQPTDVGKVIRTLHDFNGKLYSGYGDWGANTGPIVVRSFDPVTGASTSEFTMRTEQIARYLTIGNRLYAAGIDPGGGGNEEFAYRTQSSALWTGSNSPFGFVHVFDIASLDSNGIWLFGATGPDDATAFHSPDGGTTWDPKLSSTNLDLSGTAQSGGFNRLYFGGAYAGKLYTQSVYYTSSRVFNPSTNSWASGPDLLPVFGGGIYRQLTYGSRPLEFAGKMVYNGAWTGCCYGRMLSFDGQRVTQPLKPIFKQYEFIADLQVYNGYLYVLATGNSGQAVLRTADLAKWELAGGVSIGDLTQLPYSLRILNGVIYIGATNARVFSAPLPTNFTPLN